MVIAICNHKGGTGKTTTTINLGCALSKAGKRIMLIDLDPQGNLSYSLGIPEQVPELSSVLTGENELKDIIIQKEGMHVVPSNMNLSDIEFSLQSCKDREYILKNIFMPVIKDFDYILIDCPPSRSLLTVNALNFAGKVISPVLPDVLSIQGLKHIERTVYQIKSVLNEKLDFIGILVVNVDERKRLTQQIMNFIKDNFELTVFNNFIRTDVKLAEAPSHGKSVIAYAPGSKSARDYMDVANELLTINW